MDTGGFSLNLNPPPYTFSSNSNALLTYERPKGSYYEADLVANVAVNLT